MNINIVFSLCLCKKDFNLVTGGYRIPYGRDPVIQFQQIYINFAAKWDEDLSYEVGLRLKLTN